MAASLAHLIPSAGVSLRDDAILDSFVGAFAGDGLNLYPHQEEALLELLSGRHVILSSPTGSGKSLVATALHFMCMARGQRSFYTCPVKALVNEKFFALCEAFGAEQVGMMTGDASINPTAPIICCTAEILSVLSATEREDFVQAVVMDEFHYYGDRDRGVAWQLPLLALPKTQFLLMSATLGDVSSIAESLTEITGREVAFVRSATRPVPLEFSYSETPLHETVATLLRTGKSPVYLVNFSQRAAAEQAQNLLSTEVATKEEKARLREALSAYRFPTPFGKDLKRILSHGIGIHHAGMLPRYRRMVERLSQRGLLRVISGTDTLGVGVNIPIRTVLFTQLCKFDGEKMLILPVRDFLQIAGRAGRKGFDEKGWVIAQAPPHVIENARLAQKKAAGKKVVFVKPPTKGYVHWDKSTFERLRTSPPERMESRFSVSHGLLISLLQARDAGGYRRLVELIERSHSNNHKKFRLLKRGRALFQSLVAAKIVEVTKRSGDTPPSVKASSDLQQDFSLNYKLSPFLLEGLTKLELARDEYPFDVLSLVEAILEDPEPVLRAQRDVLRNARFAELKSQGVPYERRIEEVEKVTWPKPNAEFIYAAFEEFAVRHPWLGQEDIRPKGIAQELYERGFAFNEFVREYRLQRCEGLLLRYLSEVYKLLRHNVPEAIKTEELIELTEHIFTIVKLTDSSLLDEWEAMHGEEAEAPKVVEQLRTRRAPRGLLDAGPKALRARIRAEMHQLTHLIAKRDWGDIADALAQDDVWTEEHLAKTLEPFFAEGVVLDQTPRARQSSLTQVEELSVDRWRVRHAIFDTTREHEWTIEGEVDLRQDPRESRPLVRVMYIGP